MNLTRFAAPDTPQYQAAVAAYNLAADLRPQAAMTATTATEVRSALAEAASAGAPVLPFSTGHASSLIAPSTEEARLMKVALRDPVRVDPARGTVAIPAGARWGAVITAAAEHGYAVPHGSSPTVGAIGYLLRGGMSFYGRAVGVAANSVLSITIALADGTVVTVDRDRDPELFWALRGGGGGFGIVLSVTLRMLPMWNVITGATAWDATGATPIATAWRDWTATAPAAAATSLRLLRLPDAPTTPEPFRNRQILMVDGAVMVQRESDLETAREIERELLEPLRSIAAPLADTWHLGPVTDLPATHADPPDPLPYVPDHFTLAGTDDRAMELWMSAAGPESGSGLHIVELRQLGGAFASAPADGGAVSAFSAEFSTMQVAIAAPQSGSGSIEADNARLRDALGSYLHPYTTPTFVENPKNPRRSFPDEVEARIDEIRSRVDPAGMFRLDAQRSYEPRGVSVLR